MHTILGAGGPVANILTKELINHNETIRLVSRKPVNTNNNDKVTWQKADLLNYDEVLSAAKGSTVIYLVAGLVYDKDIWRAQWPVIMQNVINVTKATGARLIFFDNVYMAVLRFLFYLSLQLLPAGFRHFVMPNSRRAYRLRAALIPMPMPRLASLSPGS